MENLPQTIGTKEVEARVIELRGQKVILDRDVAELYQTETREINKAVKNNPEKFPDGYCFTLQPSEKQYVVENFHRMERLKKSTVEPRAFTERGLYMLATIMKSPRATQTTIAIIDSFTKLRELTRNIEAAGYDKRIAGVHEVTCGLGTSTEWIQSEQSVVVGGYDAFVVNNINVTNQEINDKIIGVIAIGPIVKGPQGAECVRWNTKEKKWESKWTRSDVSSVSMIPAVSIKSEMVFVCGWNDASGWEVTGLDWKSGATRHRSILGKNNRANGAYAIIQYLANGDLLFNSVAGPIRVKY